jgi:hypothetical protein
MNTPLRLLLLVACALFGALPTSRAQTVPPPSGLDITLSGAPLYEVRNNSRIYTARVTFWSTWYSERIDPRTGNKLPGPDQRVSTTVDIVPGGRAIPTFRPPATSVGGHLYKGPYNIISGDITWPFQAVEARNEQARRDREAARKQREEDARNALNTRRDPAPPTPPTPTPQPAPRPRPAPIERLDPGPGPQPTPRPRPAPIERLDPGPGPSPTPVRPDDTRRQAAPTYASLLPDNLPPPAPSPAPTPPAPASPTSFASGTDWIFEPSAGVYVARGRPPQADWEQMQRKAVQDWEEGFRSGSLRWEDHPSRHGSTAKEQAEYWTRLRQRIDATTRASLAGTGYDLGKVRSDAQDWAERWLHNDLKDAMNSPSPRRPYLNQTITEAERDPVHLRNVESIRQNLDLEFGQRRVFPEITPHLPKTPRRPD